MILFLLTYLLLYGGMHLYAFLRARGAFAMGTGTALSLALFMAFMTVAPILVRLAERGGLEGTARTIALAGYLWMGVLFLFVSASALIDLWRLLLFAAEVLPGNPLAALRPSARSGFFLALSLSLLLSLYGTLEAQALRVERLKIESRKMPRAAGTLTIVQISDVHLGLIVRGKKLARIMEVVRGADPDLLVSTGDLVDGQPNELDGLTELFRAIDPKYGKFAVTGNHEFYAGIDHSLDFTRRAGFTVLRGEGVTVEGFLTVAGVDDATGASFGLLQGEAEGALLASLPRNTFTVLLKHRPLVSKGACGLFDLQLSGHTHRGQVFPFSLVTAMSFPVNSGTAAPGEECLLHVSRGTGTWGPPIRLLAPPEITVIEVTGRG